MSTRAEIEQRCREAELQYLQQRFPLVATAEITDVYHSSEWEVALQKLNAANEKRVVAKVSGHKSGGGGGGGGGGSGGAVSAAVDAALAAADPQQPSVQPPPSSSGDKRPPPASSTAIASAKKAKSGGGGGGEVTSTGGSCVTEVKGDLFKSGSGANLAHCVSVDLRMGKGVATLFKKQFGGVDELRAQQLGIGDVGVLVRGERYVYYLITKQYYYEKPIYADLETSLVAMREHAVKYGVTEICLPRIGCGLDGMQWHRVRELLDKVFAPSNIRIKVYYL